MTHELDHQSGELLTNEGADIYFESAGHQSGPPLLLHGGFGSTEDFRAVLPVLAREHRVIAIDSRGHGRSTLGQEPLSYALLERDVVAVLARLAIERVRILGFSDGGMVGYMLAARGTVQVDKLIAVGAPCELPEDDPLRKKLAAITPAVWKQRFPQSHALYQRLNPQPDFDRFIRAVVAMASTPEATQTRSWTTSAVRSCSCVAMTTPSFHCSPSCDCASACLAHAS
jgi:pimeloyl-ACP methyl ester carboxylesterase